jgi:hypothetical protein
MKLDPKLLRDIDEADIEPFLHKEVLLRLFVEHRPKDERPHIEPYDLPFLFVLEERTEISRKLEEFLEEHAEREGTVFSMEIRPMPPLGLLDEQEAERRGRS